MRSAPVALWPRTRHKSNPVEKRSLTTRERPAESLAAGNLLRWDLHSYNRFCRAREARSFREYFHISVPRGLSITAGHGRGNESQRRHSPFFLEHHNGCESVAGFGQKGAKRFIFLYGNDRPFQPYVVLHREKPVFDRNVH